MSDLSVNIDFIVLNTVDPKTICIGDKSAWGIAETQPAYLLVYPPGSTTSINLSFVKHNLMFLTSDNLGLSCIEQCATQKLEDLDDGVWQFCLQSNYEGLNKSRYFLKTDSLRIEIDKLYIKEGIEYNPESVIVKALEKTEWLLNVAQAAMREGDKQKAMKAFNIACKTVEKYKDCKNCI